MVYWEHSVISTQFFCKSNTALKKKIKRIKFLKKSKIFPETKSQIKKNVKSKQKLKPTLEKKNQRTRN